MRLTDFAYGVALVVPVLMSTSAFSADRNTANGLRPEPALTLAQACPVGTHWVDAGYARGGKWREAHCASDTGDD
jgi:hypothetical protein